MLLTVKPGLPCSKCYWSSHTACQAYCAPFIMCRVDVVESSDATTQGYWSVPVNQVQLRQAAGSSSAAAGVCSSGGNVGCIGILDSGTSQLTASLDQVRPAASFHIIKCLATGLANSACTRIDDKCWSRALSAAKPVQGHRIWALLLVQHIEAM